MLETLYQTKNLLNEFKYMENIKSVEDFRSFIKTKDFWADTRGYFNYGTYIKYKNNFIFGRI